MTYRVFQDIVLNEMVQLSGGTMKYAWMILLALSISITTLAAPPILWETQYQVGFDAGYTTSVVCPDSTVVLSGYRGDLTVARRIDPNGETLAHNLLYPGIRDPIAMSNSDIVARGNAGVLARWDFDLDAFWVWTSWSYPIFLHYQETADGNLVVVGCQYYNEGQKHILTFTSWGSWIGDLTVQLPYEHTANDMLVLPDGHYLMSGMFLVDDELRQGFIAKIDQDSGEPIWLTLTSEEPQWEAISPDQMVLLPDGRIRVLVERYAMLDYPDLLYLSADGEIVDQKYVDDEFPNGLNNFQVCNLRDSGFLVRNAWSLFRLNAAGELVWQHDYRYEFDSQDISFNNVTPVGLQRIYWVGRSWVGNTNYGWVACLGEDTAPLRVEVACLDEDQSAPVGSTFAWHGHLRNRENVSQTVDVWTVARGPNWDVIGPIRMWNDVTIEPEATLGATLLQHIPLCVGPGEYNYILRVGEYPEYHYEAYFEFEVIE